MIRAAALIAALALALLTGCGDDDQVKADNAYVEQTNRAVRSFETQFQQLQTSITAGTREQDARSLVAMRRVVDRVVTRLRSVQAPARVAPEHARLIAEMQQYDGVVVAAQRSLSGGDRRQVLAARSRFSTDIRAVATKVAATINLINRRLQ